MFISVRHFPVINMKYLAKKSNFIIEIFGIVAQPIQVPRLKPNKSHFLSQYEPKSLKSRFCLKLTLNCIGTWVTTIQI